MSYTVADQAVIVCRGKDKIKLSCVFPKRSTPSVPVYMSWFLFWFGTKCLSCSKTRNKCCPTSLLCPSYNFQEKTVSHLLSIKSKKSSLYLGSCAFFKVPNSSNKKLNINLGAIMEKDALSATILWSNITFLKLCAKLIMTYKMGQMEYIITVYTLKSVASFSCNIMYIHMMTQ